LTTQSSSFINKYPHIIELAGVAGTGKSTLLKAMMQRNEKIRTLPLPLKVSYLSFLIKIASTWLPLYLKEYRTSRWFTVQEIRNMGYLDTWISFIRSQARTKEDIVALDPGPVHWLSSLQEFGPPITKHPRYQRWWKNKHEQWSSALEVIIWLEAPDDLCLQRVLSRAERHEIKHMPSESALRELKCYRESYEQIIPSMAAQHSLKVFFFRTDQISTQQMIDQIFSETNLRGK
jgi:shikimate kinase